MVMQEVLATVATCKRFERICVSLFSGRCMQLGDDRIIRDGTRSGLTHSTAIDRTSVETGVGYCDRKSK